ncbi:MAG TPA: hypothetical protein VG944_19815 [Fimbriimonas sp.]|nr:hypothetical protein [Fimbriimonas sp.]
MLKRNSLLSIAVMLFAVGVVGCNNSETEAVDKPLMKDAPPPPPRPNKPVLHPSGGGGGGPAAPKGGATKGAGAPE